MKKPVITIADVAANLADFARKAEAEAEAARQDELLDKLGAEMAKMLYDDNPRLVEYLESAIVVRPLWTSCYDVCGEIYATLEQAEEARTAAILTELIRAKRARQ